MVTPMEPHRELVQLCGPFLAAWIAAEDERAAKASG
jgi:hypothetical protein